MRFFVACAVGGVVATVVFAWVVLGGRADLLARESFGGFYDAQARSLLHGHWDVPANALSFERFKVGGRFFTYFGPWPALLRMPVIAFTREFDGRLSRVSMLVAFVVLLVFAARLDNLAMSHAATTVFGTILRSTTRMTGRGLTDEK